MGTEVGVKHDEGKPDWTLVPWKAMEEVVKVLDHGAKKYTAHGWRHGISSERYKAAAMRHLVAYLQGDYFDRETGLSHLAHAICCLLFVEELESGA